MPRRSIQEMATERYGEGEIAAAVVKDAEAAGTVAKIEAGELALPSEPDAVHWHRRNQEEAKNMEARSAQDERIAALEARLNELMGAERG